MKIELEVTFNKKLSKDQLDKFKDFIAENLKDSIFEEDRWRKKVSHLIMYENNECFFEYCGE